MVNSIVFFVSGENIRSVVKDHGGALSRIDPDYLHLWIRMRADYSQIKSKVILALALDDNPLPFKANIVDDQ